MSDTFGDVIDYVQSQLLGFVTDNPMYCTLTAPLTDSALSVALDVPVQSQPLGVVEIGGELIHLTSWDAATSRATVPPWGRAQQGTTAAAHPTGVKVTVAPRYPRRRIGQVVNQVVQAMVPPLFGVSHGTFTTAVDVYDYALPANTLRLLRVEQKDLSDPLSDWRPVRDSYIHRPGGVPFLHVSNSNWLNIGYRWTVAINPLPLVAETDDFSTVTGLPASCIDLVSLGSIPRLVSTNELSRQQLGSVEASERATLVPATSGTNAAKFYMSMFQDRLEAETRRLRQEYPITVTRNV